MPAGWTSTRIPSHARHGIESPDFGGRRGARLGRVRSAARLVRRARQPAAWPNRGGRSRAHAALLRALLARIGVERPIVFGHSFGALVALAYALDYPAETRGVVLA